MYRYASLYFIALVDKDDNELLTLEIIHHYVELLDKYFGNVCELDIIFNFHKVFNETLINTITTRPTTFWTKSSSAGISRSRVKRRY